MSELDDVSRKICNNENEKYNKPCPYNPTVMCVQMPGDRKADDFYCDHGCPNRGKVNGKWAEHVLCDKNKIKESENA